MKIPRYAVAWTLIVLSDFERELALTPSEHDLIAWRMENHLGFADGLTALITPDNLLSFLGDAGLEPLRLEVIRHALADVTYIDLNS